ncbi:plasmid stabilization protein [Aureimonas sp. ME7]|uniref:FitA-like ribbon-helix-helix domain-containing protein n=1 Tax=Aureimonas sp. ME7 TaxID=2744252 RepID=UPI0015F393A8|nr:plasmid stabilization protein [Aureimonas sp. ME7]
MASLTIRNIDDDLKRKLQIRAARNGRSMEQELRVALRQFADEPASEERSPEEARAIYHRIMALSRPPLEPFDQKAVSDEINDFVP